MSETEHKIKISTEYTDNSGPGLAKAKLQLLDFSKAAEKAGKDIAKNLGEGTKKAEGGAKSLASTFAGLRTATLGYVAVAVAAAAAIYKITKTISEAEETTKKFTFALENSGIKSQAGVAKFKAFASSIQQTTKYSDTAVLSLGTFFTQAGIGYDKLEVATKAAIQYSAAFGTTLEQAGDAVAASFNGQSRELGKYIPEIKRLSDEQLRAGQAADILVSKFAGTAENDKNTLGGAILSAKNALSSLVDSLSFFLMPMINAFSYAIGNIAKSVQMLTDAVEKFTGAKKKSDDVMKDPKAAEQLQKEVTLQKQRLKAEQDLTKWKEAHKDDQKTFDDLKKQADAEMGSKADQIKTEYQQRVDAINKLTAVDKDKRFNLVVQEFQLRGQKLKELYDEEAKKQEELYNNRVSNLTNLAGSVAGGDASGIASGAATAFGAGAASAGIAGLVATLIVTSKDIPKKLGEMLKGLLEGMQDGIPKLMDYLSGEFISDLMTKFIPGLVSALIKMIPAILLMATKAFAAVLKNLPSLLVGVVKGIGSGIVGAFKSIGSFFGGLFGGGPSPLEKLEMVMRELKDHIKELNRGLKENYRSILSSVSSPGGQLALARGDLNRMRGERSDLNRQVRKAAMDGDTEKTQQLLDQVQQKQLDMMNKAKEIYDMETDRVTKIYEKKKDLYEKERQLLVDRINELKDLKNTAIDSIQKAREAILTGSSTAFENVQRLRANYKNASSPEDRSAAASALAGGLQSEFESAQNLAASGAISGEEFQRVKAGILSELDSTQGQITSEFDQLISVQKEQIRTLDAGFKLVTKEYKQEMARLREVLLDISKKLSALPKYAQGTPYVPQTQLAVLHEGEKVIPKGMNGGGITVNINGVPAGANRAELVKAIREILTQNSGNVRGAIQKSVG